MILTLSYVLGVVTEDLKPPPKYNTRLGWREDIKIKYLPKQVAVGDVHVPLRRGKTLISVPFVTSSIFPLVTRQT